MRSHQALRFIFLSFVMFFVAFNFLDICMCHSLWELADFVSFPAMSGTVVVFVSCINVLFDKTKPCSAAHPVKSSMGEHPPPFPERVP